jgi:hypothetical protein
VIYEVAATAGLVDLNVPDKLSATCFLGDPAVLLIKACSPLVPRENPKNSLRISRGDEVRAGRGDEGDTETTTPIIRVDVKSGKFSQAECAGIGRRHGGGETEDLVSLNGNKSVRPLWIGVGEVVFGSALFGTKAVEVAVRQEAAIRGLP